MAKLIGLAGRMGSGKSTVATILRERFGYVELTFSGPLKALAGYLLAIPRAQLYGPSSARNATIPGAGSADYWRDVRSCLWSLTTDEVLRALVAGVEGGALLEYHALASLSRELRTWEAIGALLTVRHVLQRLGAEWGRALHPELWIRAALREAAAHDRAVISDCRFPNEAAAIADAGGVVYWLTADARIGPRPADAHASEPRRYDLDLWLTGDIDTAGDLAALAPQVAALVEAV